MFISKECRAILSILKKNEFKLDNQRTNTMVTASRSLSVEISKAGNYLTINGYQFYGEHGPFRFLEKKLLLVTARAIFYRLERERNPTRGDILSHITGMDK